MSECRYTVVRYHPDHCPTVFSQPHGPWEYPFHDCDVGDYFVVPYRDSTINNLRQLAKKFGDRRNAAYKCTREADGIRVTRIR